MMEFVNVAGPAKKQGNVGVMRALYEYTKLGYTVLVPISDSDAYDLVVDTDDGLKRVQVKTSRCRVRKGYAVNLATKGGNTKVNTVRRRQESDYDWLFCLIETGDCWSIPVEALDGASTAITVTSSKYTQYKLI